MEHYILHEDQLAIGLTKPATRWGVPLMPFYLNILVCFLGGMFFQSFMVLAGLGVVVTVTLIWFVVYTLMFLMTYRDPFGLHIAWMNSTSFRSHQTRSLWGNTDSFSP